MTRMVNGQPRRLGLFDVVRVRRAPPGSGLVAGEEGTIVEVFDHPHRAFLVDFSGATAADPHGDDPVRTLTPTQSALVWKYPGR